MKLKIKVRQIFDNQGKETILIENQNEKSNLEVGKEYLVIIAEKKKK